MTAARRAARRQPAVDDSTYRVLDKQLHTLGFVARTVKDKARVYKHEPTGATIYLPDVRLDDAVLQRHLVVVRHVLGEYSLGELDPIGAK